MIRPTHCIIKQVLPAGLKTLKRYNDFSGVLEKMKDKSKESDSTSVQAARLLGRSGRVLGLAAVAHVHGQRSGKGPWHVLSPETIAATEEILLLLEQGPKKAVLEAVLEAALAPEPATAAPGWTEPVWRDPLALSRLGKALDVKRLAPALGPGNTDPSDREKGLAGIALALCRSSDGLAALAAHLEKDDRLDLKRMACLAQVLVEPHEPTQMRDEIRRLLREDS